MVSARWRSGYAGTVQSPQAWFKSKPGLQYRYKFPSVLIYLSQIGAPAWSIIAPRDKVMREPNAPSVRIGLALLRASSRCRVYRVDDRAVRPTFFRI